MGVVFSVELINIVGPRPEPWGIPDVSGIGKSDWIEK